MTSGAVRVLVSHAAASIGMSMPWPLLLLVVWSSTHDDALLGLTGAARMLPYVAVSWAAGRLADRYCRHRLVLLTLLGRTACLTGLAVAVAADQLVWAVASATLCIAFATPAYPALAAGMPRLAGAGTARATTLLVTIEVSSFVVGPAVGGLLLAPPLRPWIPVTAVLLLLVAVVAMRGVDMPAPERSTVRAAGRGVARLMLRTPSVMHALLAVCAVSTVVTAAGLVLLPLSEQAWRDGDLGFGVATAAFGFGGLAGPILARLGRDTAGQACWSLTCVGLALLLVAGTPGVGWAVVPLVIAGAAAVQVEGVATSTFQRATPDQHRASVLGIADSAIVAAALLGSVVGPTAATWAGPRSFLALLGAATVVLVADARRIREPAYDGKRAFADPAMTSSPMI